MCINPTQRLETPEGIVYNEEYKIYGSKFDGGNFSEISVRFRSCTLVDNVANGCKSSEEIVDWLANKNIFVLYNDYEFKANNFDEPVQKKSKSERFKIQPSGRYEYSQFVRKMKFNLSDSLWSIGLLFSDKIDGFTVVDQSGALLALRSWDCEEEEPTCIITEVKFSQDKDLYKYVRNAYTILDLLRDIGGLFGALNAIFTALVFLLNFDGLYQWLTSHLFRVQLMPDYLSRRATGVDRRVHSSAMA